LVREGLFQLDVDDEIWLDISLGDDEGPTPAWLGDENVRLGIKTLLQWDRCVEEEARLKKELGALQQWMKEEWMCVQTCIDIAGMFCCFAAVHLTDGIPDDDPDLQYQFRQRADHLKRLCVTWQTQLQPIDFVLLQEWGPSEEELLGSNPFDLEDNWNTSHGDDTEQDEGVEAEASAELVEGFEALALADAYRNDNNLFLE
jgi:hypothetical protein